MLNILSYFVGSYLSSYRCCYKRLDTTFRGYTNINMLKLIHTSDWHLGHVLYGYDRFDEFENFFNRLKEIVRWEVPDALLVSGDIFDVSNPPAGVARLFKDRLLEIHALVPDMTVIVTAGNHDSASRIDVDRNLWRLGGIHVFGSVPRSGGEYDFSGNIVKIRDKGIVAAIPFVNRAFLPKLDKELTPERAFFSGVEKCVENMNPEGLPAVLMAHLAVEGCDTEGHREPTVGGMDKVSEDIFGPTWSYVALGHIHKPQSIGKGGRVAYSGTPVAVSFDEKGRHSVNVVTVDDSGEIDIQKVEIEPLRPLLTIPEEGVDFRKALRVLAKFPDNEEAYIRLNILQEEPLPVDCTEQATAKAMGKVCRFCTFKYTDASHRAELKPLTELKAFEFSEISPQEIAAGYFRRIGESEEKIQGKLELISSLIKEIEQENQA